jgi:hypothetical protein
VCEMINFNQKVIEFLKKRMSRSKWKLIAVSKYKILSKNLIFVTFRRQNAQIIGKSGFRPWNFDLGGGPVFGTFFGPFCLCFADISVKICRFYNGKRKVLLCAFLTRFTQIFAKVFFYKLTHKFRPLQRYAPVLGSKKTI